MAPVPQNDFRCVCRHVRMSGSATPATQNDIITCFDTLKQDRFCSFPHRHGHGKRKQEHRDGTCWSLKTSISWETSSNACSHFSASKSTFCYGFLMNLKNCYVKIDVSCEASVNFQHISQNDAPATEFARCHHLTQP